MVGSLTFSPWPRPDRALDDSDPFLWLESETDERTELWLTAERDRLAAAFPPKLTHELEFVLKRAMESRAHVASPVQRGGWCYRYDAHEGTWLRSQVHADRRLGPWHHLQYSAEEIDTTLASNFVVCPFSSSGWPAGSRAMIRFTHGATDAAESREVDLVREVVLNDGLRIPRSIHDLSWDGPDAVIVSRRVEDEAGGSHWVVDRIRRGESWENSTRLHDFARDRVAASITRDTTATPARYLMTEWLDHRRRTYRVGHLGDGGLHWTPIPVPEYVRVQLLGDVALLVPLAPWEINGNVVTAGDLLTAPLADLLSGTGTIQVVYRLAEQERMLRLACSRNYAMLVVRDTRWTKLIAVDPRRSETREITRIDASAAIRAIPVDITDDACSDEFWIESAGPVIPPKLVRVDAHRPTHCWVVEEGTGTFHHEDFTVQVSRVERGLLPPVEYTVVAPVDMPLDGQNPTILSGYGGFNVPERIDYLDLTGPTWLDRTTPESRRCVFVFANVGRGFNGRIAPWERLASSVEQFLAVADQLARDLVARPERLGALGVSHGGLLVLNAMLTRPTAFGAVSCRSAVLDLLRYPELDGTAWVAEYGDPRDPAARAAMLPHSPYHRISTGVRYPPVLLWSSADDDRVSPAHSRKTAARLRAAGGTAFYLESQGGGHDALGSTPVGAQGLALTAAFFRHHLVDRLSQ